MSSLGVLVRTAGVVFLLGVPFVLWRNLGSADEPRADRLSFEEAFGRGPLATTEDAQSFDQLQRELERLVGDAPALESHQLKQEVLVRTTEYLELDSDVARAFVATAEQALAELAAGRARVDAANRDAAQDADPTTSVETRRAAWNAWQSTQREAADQLLLPELRGQPRLGLFAEQRLAWLLQLDYGLQVAERSE